MSAGWITPGRRYVLRSGKRVRVTGAITVRFGPGHRFVWNGIKGTAGSVEMVWDELGMFTGEGQHPNDIVSVERAPVKKRKGKK